MYYLLCIHFKNTAFFSTLFLIKITGFINLKFCIYFISQFLYNDSIQPNIFEL